MLADYDAEAIADVLGLIPSYEPLEAGGDLTDAGHLSRSSDAAAVLVLSEQTFYPAASAVLIERAVTSGLPRASLQVVAERIAGNDDEAVAHIVKAIASPDGDLRGKLSVPESERTERLARLFVQARRALGTEAEARSFLEVAHPELDGRTPLEATRTDLGARRVERLLKALEYGLAL